MRPTSVNVNNRQTSLTGLMTVAAGGVIAITFPISPRISRWSYQDYSCLSAGSSAGLAAVAGSHAGYSDTLL